jgi:non-homologous end joining protein Ku
MRIIQAKTKGKSVELEPAIEPRESNVIDLMERLRRSLAETSRPGRRAARPRTVKKTSSRKRTRHAA